MGVQKKKSELKLSHKLMGEIEKIVSDRVKAIGVTREDFSELKEIVKEMGSSILKLAEAQRRTEEGLNEFKKISEESFRRVWESINQLTLRVDQLAEAQRRTEEALNEFKKATEENFKRVWEAINQLAEAQRRTEERLNWLIDEHRRTREILAGISDTVGYGLEDKIMIYMKGFARDEYGIEAEIVERRNVVYPNGKYKDGERAYVVGECKSRPSKKEIDDFVKSRKRLENYLNSKVYSFIVGYSFAPEVESYLRDKYPEIKMFKSYEFELRYGKGSG